VYANSEASGRAIGKHLDGGAARESLFILTKLMQRGIPDPMGETQREVELLQCKGYADAVLLHRPPRGENGLPSNVDAWKLLEAVKDKGLAR
jgi:diketogulonate reductase-like aldo/keto reductase